jgi:NtrC-family two-component system response regulator AlgB
MEIQPKLLRLLQEREYERVGENVIRPAEVRVIAATSRDLRKRAAEGTFREDLHFRLNVITAEMPQVLGIDQTTLYRKRKKIGRPSIRTPY